MIQVTKPNFSTEGHPKSIDIRECFAPKSEPDKLYESYRILTHSKIEVQNLQVVN